MKKIREIIGLRIKTARKAANLTQSELAQKLNISLTTVNRLEKGHQMPHPGNLELIAKTLNIDNLFEGFEDSNRLESQTGKADLIIEITSRLSSLNENELRAALTVIDNAPSAKAGRPRTGAG